MDAPTQRIAFVDGLRAMAALAVVCCHTAMIVPIWETLRYAAVGVPFAWFGHILIDGGHGVDLFFVLSGFCLSYPTLLRVRASGQTSFDLVRYAAHRAVRILPPYYATIGALVVLGVLLLVARHRGFVVPGADPFDAGDVLRQLALLDYRTSLLDPPFWTLLVELRWYFLFPIALVLWVRAPRALWAGMLAAVIGYSFTRMHNLDLGVLPAFLLGIVAADLEIKLHWVRGYALALTAACVALAVLLEPFASMPSVRGVDEPSFLAQTNPGWHLAAFFFVLAAGNRAWLRRALSSRALVALGTASYSLYLVHYPIVMLLGPHLMRAGALVGFPATVAAAVLGGLAFWWLAERHFCGGPVRGRFIAAVTAPIGRAFAAITIPRVVVLAEPLAVALASPAFEMPPPFPEVAAVAGEAGRAG